MVAAGPPAAVMVGSPPLHGNLSPPIPSMDALKARIMDVAPGQVKQAICSAQFVPRQASGAGGRRRVRRGRGRQNLCQQAPFPATGTSLTASPG